MQDTKIGSPINDTTIHKISQWLHEDTLIAASDGSEISGNGAHAYGFTSKSSVTQIFGSAMRTPGNPQEMSSLRAEHAGIITLILYLQYFQTRFAHSSSTIIIYIDSQAVLDRLDAKPTFAMKDHESLDYDLWQLQHHLLLHINFTIHWIKIKSHASVK